MKKKIMLALSMVMIGSMLSMGVYATKSQIFKAGNKYSIQSENNRINHNKSGSINKTTISPKDAEKIVTDKLQNCEIKEIKLKEKHGDLIYKIEALKDDIEYEYKIDAKTGKILKEETEAVNEWDTEKYINSKNTKINLENAKKIATENNKGYEVKEYELKNKNNKYIYEIEIYNGTENKEVKIDANNGKILSVETDD